MAAIESYKMSDAPIRVAVDVFSMFNPGKVNAINHPILGLVVITNENPKDLVYPEGWQYKDGCFCNQHHIDTGLYEEVLVLKPNGKKWEKDAIYVTLDG